jgi:hypothetical protein
LRTYPGVAVAAVAHGRGAGHAAGAGRRRGP